MLYEMLSEKEKDMMVEYIDRYGYVSDHSKRTNEVNLPCALREWDKQKQQYLYDLLGKSLIISKPVSYDTPINEMKENIVKKFFYSEGEKTFMNALSDYYYNTVRPWKSPLYDFMCHMTDYLATNIYEGPTFILEKDGVELVKIVHGTKTMKALGKIADALNLPGFEEFRIECSQITNTRKLTGNLVLSIHPMDYMTMSDNTCNWSSCMNWDGGEYRQGTVEMMNSSAVVVAYLESNVPYRPVGGESQWHNKKWRQLFIITPDIIANVKAYPFKHDELTKITLNWLRDLAEKNLEWSYSSHIFNYNHDETIYCDFLDKNVLIRFGTERMYNDFGRSQWAYLANDFPSQFYFNYSGEGTCMVCGDYLDYDDEEFKVVCGNCEPIHYCYDCGDAITDDDYYEVDGVYYCSSCYEMNFTECEICCQTHHNDNSYRVYLEGSSYSIEMCENCYENPPEKYFINPNFEKDDNTYYCPSVNISELTDEGLKLFGFNSREEALAEIENIGI